MCVILIHSVRVQFGQTPLMEAAHHGHTAIVKYLVEETTAEVNATSKVSHRLHYSDNILRICTMCVQIGMTATCIIICHSQ